MSLFMKFQCCSFQTVMKITLTRYLKWFLGAGKKKKKKRKNVNISIRKNNKKKAQTNSEEKQHYNQSSLKFFYNVTVAYMELQFNISENVSDTLDCNFMLTRLITWKDFIAFSHHESLKPYVPVLTWTQIWGSRTINYTAGSHIPTTRMSHSSRYYKDVRWAQGLNSPMKATY
jgi:hypothetical protein